jgi:hypothetical protein
VGSAARAGCWRFARLGRLETNRARGTRNIQWWSLGSITVLGLIAVIIGAWRANVTEDEWSDSL